VITKIRIIPAAYFVAARAIDPHQAAPYTAGYVSA
jgi:hypothetical protein